MTITAKEAKRITKEVKKHRNNFANTNDYTLYLVEIAEKIKKAAIKGYYYVVADFVIDFLNINDKLMIKRTLTQMKLIISYLILKTKDTKYLKNIVKL